MVNDIQTVKTFTSLTSCQNGGHSYSKYLKQKVFYFKMIDSQQLLILFLLIFLFSNFVVLKQDDAADDGKKLMHVFPIFIFIDFHNQHFYKYAS